MDYEAKLARVVKEGRGFCQHMDEIIARVRADTPLPPLYIFAEKKEN